MAPKTSRLRGRFLKYSVENRAKLAREIRKSYPEQNTQHINKNRCKNTSGAVSIEETFMLSGRRVIHLKTLANQLKQCQNASCTSSLHLFDCCMEKRYGLASFLYIKCRSCQITNVITTDTQMESEKRGMKPFTINQKVALGMLHSGIGETHLNNFLSSIDVPPICQKTLKKSERSIGNVVEGCAKVSCNNSLDEEILLTEPSILKDNAGKDGKLSAETILLYQKRLEEGYDLPDASYDNWKIHQNNTTLRDREDTLEAKEVDISYDMGWQKRGRAMNSLTGVGAAIGLKTGKVVGYATRNKRCITCDVADREGRPAQQHDCRRNHCGSSKAMEPAAAVDIARQYSEKNIKIRCLVGDDDSSTIKALRDQFGDIAKLSDIGHCKRGLGSKLYECKTKDRSCKQLTDKTIKYFMKMFSYALQQNHKDSLGLKKTLLTIVPHAYGDHKNCCDSWCGYLQAPQTYKHAGLPYGKDLKCEHTRSVISTMFDSLAENASKLSPLGSSQANESFNNIVCLKGPKSRHYGGSESQDFRTAAAVLQKNSGHSYISEVTVTAGMSPSAYAVLHATRNERAKVRRRATATTKIAKIRRRVLREKRCQKQSSSEVREGTMYKSRCSLLLNDRDLDCEQIPDAVDTPVLKIVNQNTNYCCLVFDIETTGFARDAQITQICASELDTAKCFARYLLPTEPISQGAEKVTGLRVNDMQMYFHDKRIDSLSQNDGLLSFITWCETFPKQIVLIAHNCFSFDMRVLVNALKRHNLLERFCNNVAGFADSLPALKIAYPGQDSYSLGELFNNVFDSELEGAHNALNDVKALVKLLKAQDMDLCPSAVTVLSVNDVVLFSKECTHRLSTLRPLVVSKIISKHMASKIASSGLTYNHLKLASTRNGGVSALFKEPLGKSYRITTNKNIIANVATYFTNQ